MTVAGILALKPQDRQEQFKAVGIDKVVIDLEPFTDYKAFSFIREKSYLTSPTRSADGTIDNLNSYASFTTPHLKIDFSLLSIGSYRRLMNLIYSKNEFVVKCYDIVRGEVVTEKMYFATEEMPKLWTIARLLNGERSVALLGVQDYTVEMVGTNADIDLVEVLYFDENNNLIAEATQSVYKGTEAIIGYNYIPQSPFRFDGIWITKDGGKISNDTELVVTETIKLKADVKNEKVFTLSFNYGKGIEPIESTTAQAVTSVDITQGQTIATAISKADITTTDGVFAFPANGTGLANIEYKVGEETKIVSGDTAYSFKDWYWDSEGKGSAVTGNTSFNYSTNRTIFQVYEKKPFTVTFVTNKDQIKIDTQTLGFGDSIIAPKLALKGWNFVGWFLNEEFTIAKPKTMIPENITLYAKWELLI